MSSDKSDASMVDEALGLTKPRCLISETDPHATIERVARHLATSGAIFDRNGPVRIYHDGQERRDRIQPLRIPDVIRELDRVSRPFGVRLAKKGKKDEEDVCLSSDLAAMYLSAKGEWGLQPLDGIASAPLLADDGSIRAATGYDATTRMWCEGVPDVAGLVPIHPTKEEAEAALLAVRQRFQTFAYADATRREGSDNVARVAVELPPGQDESSFLVALLTAVCRPSLDLAPALAICGAGLSGSGTGKGLLVACLTQIAYGHRAGAVSPGKTAEEFEKRIGGALLAAVPCLLLDNLNGRTVTSDVLASVLTERPAVVRRLGVDDMARLNASSFIAITGNSLQIGEDLVRRFLTVQLDARVEDPEARAFPGNIEKEVAADRPQLLAALLTIWRWGRVAPKGLIPTGAALGSFPLWCRWVRDPLLALGCKDPAKRVSEAKARDPIRSETTEILKLWHESHGSKWVIASELADVVKVAISQDPNRQALAPAVNKLAGTRLGGFVLEEMPNKAKWSATKYRVTRTYEGGDALLAELEAISSSTDGHARTDHPAL